MKLSVRRVWGRLGSPVRDDSGFSLIEAVVALFVAAVAFTGLAVAGLSAVKGTLVSRQNQQASDFMAREMEAARALDFGSLANVAADIAADPAVDTCSGKPCIDPGTGTKEIIWTGAPGTVGAIKNIQTVSGGESNQTDFTIRTYVTKPTDTYGADYRRVTVIAEWSVYGTQRERRISSIVAFSQLGLPLPVFKLTPQGSTSMSVNPPAQAVFGFKLTNQGAPDRFSLTEDDAESWTWVYDNGDGVFDPASDTTAVEDTNGDGVRDTGRLNPNGSTAFWVVRDVTTLGTTTTTWSATSVAQPGSDGGTQTASTTVTGTSGAVTPTPTVTPTTPPPSSDCPPSGGEPSPTAATGYTSTTYTLHNLSTPGNSTAQALLDLSKNGAVATSLYEYSTDIAAGQPGRVLTVGGTFSSGTPAQRADWRAPVGRKAYSGTATVSLWVAAPVGDTVTSVNLTAYVYKWVKVGGTYSATQMAAVPLTVNPFSCSGFQKVTGVSPSFTEAQLPNNSELGVRIVNTGTASVRIAYDVAGSYPATLVVPEK